jgi:hypothetical protein
MVEPARCIGVANTDWQCCGAQTLRVRIRVTEKRFSCSPSKHGSKIYQSVACKARWKFWGAYNQNFGFNCDYVCSILSWTRGATSWTRSPLRIAGAFDQEPTNNLRLNEHLCSTPYQNHDEDRRHSTTITWSVTRPHSLPYCRFPPALRRLQALSLLAAPSPPPPVPKMRYLFRALFLLLSVLPLILAQDYYKVPLPVAFAIQWT